MILRECKREPGKRSLTVVDPEKPIDFFQKITSIGDLFETQWAKVKKKKKDKQDKAYKECKNFEMSLIFSSFGKEKKRTRRKNGQSQRNWNEN